MAHPVAYGAAAKTVLAADDNPSNLRLLGAIIESQGYRFVGVASGLECLDLAKQYAPSLIILDVEMPEMNGFETCRRLRSREFGVRVPVAFYTAHRLDSDLREGIAAGGNDFLLKPIETEKLIARVRRWTEAGAKPRLSQAARAGLPPGAVLWV